MAVSETTAVEVLQPDSWEEALELKAAHPDAVPIAGGTDLMVELNFDRIRPLVILDLTRIPELTDWAPENGRLRVGAGVTYARLIDELGDRLPGLAIAARTVGSPQIRNCGTVGGNLGTSSPAGDGLPPLFASDADVELASTAGTRRIAVREFVTGPKRNCLADDELIAAFHIAPADGPQQFAKIGARNAMVIAVCSLALSSLVGSAKRGRVHRLRRAHADPGQRSRALHRRSAGRARPVEHARTDSGRGGGALRRARAACRAANRRRAWDRRLPTSRAWRARTADAYMGVGGLPVRLTLTVNGALREVDGVWEGESLLYALREHLGLPGSKNACEQGECGSCSVYLDGRVVCSCLVLAAQAQGRDVVTIEGIANGDGLDEVQRAFVEAGAVQCGFCTPGLIVASHDLLRRNPRPSDPEIREALAGNLCRCTGYEKILDAVRLASERIAGAEQT